MNTAVALIVAFLLPTAAGFTLMGGVRALRWAGERRCRPPAAEPIERLSANLRRLRAELEATETRVDLPAKALRLRALRGAYLDTWRWPASGWRSARRPAVTGFRKPRSTARKRRCASADWTSGKPPRQLSRRSPRRRRACRTGRSPRR